MATKTAGEPFWQKGLRFECVSCGNCCRHEPGYVFLSPEDLERLVRHHGVSRDELVRNFCRVVDLGIADRLSLTEKSNNDCIFWNQGCTVYKARPLQCRTYPFWPAILTSREAWTTEGRSCPGIGNGPLRTKSEISAALRARDREIFIDPRR